ncbi:putative F-box protein At3g16210 [Mercurialis annua]|uniref:putative F-box protein At3g16210 n=1 Tax=Mercurialis annua TaxID=3986 RepID=UPI0021604210|nr:putative F-box protein At3g16210 [Mercurialis annua]
MFEFLPEEIVVQILSRLPAKSVLKFSCACKLWNSIIKNPNFIPTFSSNKHHPCIFILHYDGRDLKYKYSMRFDDEDFDEYLFLQPVCNPPDEVGEVIGSSGGLVCLCYQNSRIDKLIICNPCIRKSLVIPKYSAHPFGWIRNKLMGFGFDSRTNDYKLFLAHLAIDSITNVLLYSLNSNSWKKITITSVGRNYIF